MTRPSHILAILVIAALALTACGNNGGSDIMTPRRRAYPRIAATDSVYAPVGGLPLHLEANAAAIAARDTSASASGSTWINICYPMYGPKATIFCTITPITSTAQLNSVVDNRIERISLNSGGNPGEMLTLENPAGYRCRLVVNPAGTVTPVQFLAYNPRHVVTGAFYLDDINQAAPDSVAPVIAAVRRDVIHLLKTLR